MVRILFSVFFFMLCVSTLRAQKKNVLFIMADDFNFWLNKIGYNTQTITPNLDRLANRGILFTNASCSSPVCNPSRNALWSGLRPSTTGISSNSGGYVREIPGLENIITMHQYFKQNGYYVYGGGKLWHPGKMGATETDPENWSAIYTGATGANGGPFYKWESAIDDLFKWSAGEYNVEEANDTKLARNISGLIKSYDSSPQKDKPFFISCGFFRPHLPWNCNKQFWDLFNPDTLTIPKGYIENDLDDIANTSAAAIHKEIVGAGQWKNGIHAYLANMAYADFNVNIVLEALDSSSFASNTIVCFMGDHGWQLGEKDRWSKYALYDGANHTTLIIYDPSAKGNQKICTKVVSLQDLYPTLVALCGLSEKTDIEGNNLQALLENPDLETWEKPIIMTYSGTNVIKTNQWRFVDSEKSPQLYNIKDDPFEWYNLVEKPEYGLVIHSLKQQLDSIVNYGTMLKGIITSTGNIQAQPKPRSILKSNVVIDSCLFLDLTYTGFSVDLSVYDLTGRKIQKKSVAGECDNVMFRLEENMKSGLYILHFKDDEREFSEKFVKN